MKKNACVFILIICSVLALPSFAYISGKIPVDEKRIYCPDQITCTENNIASCKYNTDNPQYWGQISVYGGQGLNMGTYKFKEVISGYHTGGTYNIYTVCKYGHRDSGIEIDLSAKIESRLEAYYDKTTKWELSSGGPQPYCKSDTPNSCPLKEKSGFVVINNNDQHYQLVFSIPTAGSTGDYIFFDYEGAANCWGSKQCKIEIAMTSEDLGRIPVGSVIVDMDNKMKILEIIPFSSSGMNIKKVEPFNAIEIKKSDSSPAFPSLEIISSIRSRIIISSNGISITEVRWGHASVFSYRVAEACPNNKECKIDLKTDLGGLIGSVVVDMENNMNILSVQTTRSSEIRVNEVGAHKIEISYPNKK